MYSLDYLYTKKQFKRIIKRLSEDESAVWFDHLEREIQEFSEIKQAYQTEVIAKRGENRTVEEISK